MTETIKNWLTQLYEREIKEALSSISNERIWMMGTDVWEEEKMLSQVVKDFTNMLAELAEKTMDFEEE